jgi:hypothetical protein
LKASTSASRVCKKGCKRGGQSTGRRAVGTATKPGAAMTPMPGVAPRAKRRVGKQVQAQMTSHLVVVVGDCALGLGTLGLGAQCGPGSAHWGPRLGACWRTGLFAFGSRAQGPPQAEKILRIGEVVVGNCALGRWGQRPLRIGVAGPKAPPAHWALCCAHTPGVSNSRY